MSQSSRCGKCHSNLVSDFPAQKFEQFVCDLAKPEQITALAEHFDKQFEHAPDVLVNNAAIVRIGDWLSSDPASFDEVYAVNLRAVHLVSGGRVVEHGL